MHAAPSSSRPCPGGQNNVKFGIAFWRSIRYDLGVSERYEAEYATAVMPILAWVSSNHWMDVYENYTHNFYSDLTDVFDAPIEEILAALPTPLWARAARCSFDDFLTEKFEPSPSNALDQYLDEIGMDLEEADVDFLIAFRTSVVRVYHVVSRTPYESVILRDLTGGAKPVQIEDEMLTAALSTGDNIATRIVTIKDKDYLAGSILVLSDEMLETFKHGFELAFKDEMRSVEKCLQKDVRQKNIVRQRVLRGAARAVSAMWVASVLLALKESPLAANEDDPDTSFQATIPYDSELEPIVECLDAHPDLERPIANEFLWLWHGDRADPETSLKAMVWFSGQDICFESCERSRIEEAIGILRGLLGDFLGEATIEEVDSEIEGWGELDEEEDEEDAGPFPGPMPDEDESAFRKRIHEYLDDQFRSLLENPVPELGERVPRELAKTVKGRNRLRKWLASVEGRLRSSTDQFGIADYDLKWIWKELGMEAERQCSLFD
jgi:hypothetical protein